MENHWSGIKSVIGMEQPRFILICAEGISQAGMLAFQFGAAREREKLAKRVSHRLSSKDGKNKAQEKLQDYMRCTVPENESDYFPKLVNRVRFLKEEQKGVGQMCEIFDQVRQEGIEYGRQEGIEFGRQEGISKMIISIDKLINSLGITKERACEIMGLDLLEYEKALSGQLLAHSEDLMSPV